jgi:hypothetical protein
MPGVARIVGDGFVDGQPFEACPRQVLRRAGDAAWPNAAGNCAPASSPSSSCCVVMNKADGASR